MERQHLPWTNTPIKLRAVQIASRMLLPGILSRGRTYRMVPRSLSVPVSSDDTRLTLVSYIIRSLLLRTYIMQHYASLSPIPGTGRPTGQPKVLYTTGYAGS